MGLFLFAKLSSTAPSMAMEYVPVEVVEVDAPFEKSCAEKLPRPSNVMVPEELSSCGEDPAEVIVRSVKKYRPFRNAGSSGDSGCFTARKTCCDNAAVTVALVATIELRSKETVPATANRGSDSVS